MRDVPLLPLLHRMEERAGERRLPVLMNNACSNIGVNEPPLPRPSPPFGLREGEGFPLACRSSRAHDVTSFRQDLTGAAGSPMSTFKAAPAVCDSRIPNPGKMRGEIKVAPATPRTDAAPPRPGNAPGPTGARVTFPSRRALKRFSPAEAGTPNPSMSTAVAASCCGILYLAVGWVVE
jgi:hypothetical protein